VKTFANASCVIARLTIACNRRVINARITAACESDSIDGQNNVVAPLADVAISRNNANIAVTVSPAHD